MILVVVLHLTLLSGPRGLRLRSLCCKKLFVSLLLLWGLIVWVGGDGLWLLFLPSAVLILTAGLAPLVWSWRVSPVWKCSFLMNFGLVRGLSWRLCCPSTSGGEAQLLLRQLLLLLKRLLGVLEGFSSLSCSHGFAGGAGGPLVCLEELEALGWLVWLEDLEVTGVRVPLVAPSVFG